MAHPADVRWFRRCGQVPAAMLAAATLAGCVSGGLDTSDAPAWFQERVAAAKGGDYPDLRGIPQATPPERTLAEWDALERSLSAAGRAIQTDPAAAPAQTGDVAGFEAEARRAVTPPPVAP